MRKLFALLLIIFSLFCISATNQIGGVTDPDSVGGVPNESTSTVGGVTFTQAGGASYLLSEDFEGAGYENGGWSETVGTNAGIDEDYTTTVLAGSQSLFIDGGNGWSGTKTESGAFAATSPAYAYFMFRPTDVTGEKQIFKFEDSSNNSLMLLDIYDNDTKLYCGTPNTNAADNLYSAGTTYHIWAEYTKGSGSNAVCRVYISTDATKPGTPAVEITNGTNTTDAVSVVLQMHGNNAEDSVIFDKLRVSSSVIGNSPE